MSKVRIIFGLLVVMVVGQFFTIRRQEEELDDLRCQYTALLHEVFFKQS